jgi:hypothetical protein
MTEVVTLLSVMHARHLNRAFERAFLLADHEAFRIRYEPAK